MGYENVTNPLQSLTQLCKVVCVVPSLRLVLMLRRLFLFVWIKQTRHNVLTSEL